MSLRPDDERSGRSGRSRSRTRERSRSRDARVPSPNPKTSSSSKDTRKPRFTEDEKDEPKGKSATFEPTPAPRYEVRQPSTVMPGLSSMSSSRKSYVADEEDDDDDDEQEPNEPEMPKPAPSYRTSQPASQAPTDVRSSRGIEMPSFPSIPEPDLTPRSPTSSVPYPPYSGGMYPDDDHGSYTMMPKADYAVPNTFKYAPPPDKISYSSKPQYPSSQYPTSEQYGPPSVPHSYQPSRQYSTSSVPRNPSFESQAPETAARSSSYSSYSSNGPQVREVRPREVKPRDERQRDERPRDERQRDERPRDEKPREELPKDTIDPNKASRRVSTNDPHLDVRAPSGLAPRMDRLSVSGNRPDVSGHGLPPASPLLEAYHGTYQSMPSPMMLPEDDVDDIPPLSPISTTDSTAKKVSIAEPKSQKKRVKIYDAEADADALASAMSHSTARPGPLIDVLPELTHDQLLKLRDEYKKKVKVQNRGVNIAKHIKMKTTGNFGKICYVTALGRWESESYWANFWYQSRSSSRELLIEALMGRTNADIREIKDSFRDKRYDDSLALCMEKELKPDKFRTAVLMALEGRRQEETDTWPVEYRNQDVEMLNRALRSREGGESAILQIVVRRSDNHLREVLRTYEQVHEANFAREALKKSNNLVGEVIAHILNGCINRPARDALLLRHAIEDITAKNRAVELRYELLMSRLIRLHWDRLHLGKVKAEYKKKYGDDLEADVEEATRAEFGEFCLRLCET